MRGIPITALALVALFTQTMSAADATAKIVVANASKAMGIDNLTSLWYNGTAQNGNLGQNNNSSQPWPLSGINNYVRAIDFTVPASRATWMTYDEPVTGGAATLAPGQQNITPRNMAWAQQLEIWITPWGFLKGAAANNATLVPQPAGSKYQVVAFNSPIKSPGGKPYRVVGYIDSRNLVTRVQTWLENPVFGDMLIDTEYNFYRTGADGLKFPAQIIQKRGGWPTFTAFILGAHANPSDIQARLTPPPGRGAGRGGAAPAAAAAPPPGSTSEKLADGVYRIKAPYNSLAVEFADYIVLFEPGPQNEERALAGIAETKRLFPNKPIRYGVITHHHFDHTGGLEAVAAEGITIVTPEVNKAFLMTALSGPRTLAPDALAKSGKKPVIEGFQGDKRVFQDATRTLEIHVIKGLPHADGLVIGYLPKEKILVYADMFNLPTASEPVPNPPVIGTGVFLDNIERLHLEPERIMSIHNLNPDRLTTVAEIKASLGRN
jgi:glyoxylase-like metal-dependent hydrolase (beta-lactamase superfamily II)